MSVTKTRRKEVDRFTANAVTNVSKNTPAQQKIVDELNAKRGGKKTPAKKK